MANHTVRTQWGSLSSTFSGLTETQKDALADITSSYCRKLAMDTGCPVLASYGTLLGMCRDQDFIPHDYDVDLVLVAPSDHAEMHRVIVRLLRSLDADERAVGVRFENNVQIGWYVAVGDQTVKIEVFVGWIEGGRFFQWFAVDGCPADAVLPPKQLPLRGRMVPVPARPQIVLQHIYGQTWRTPDERHRHDVEAIDYGRFAFSGLRTHCDYWSKYYRRGAANQVWAVSPTPFSQYVAERVRPSARLIEIGAGNGRDLREYLRRGFAVTGSEAVNEALSHWPADAETLKLDLHNTLDVLNHSGGYHAIVGRFLLHSMARFGQLNVFLLAARCLSGDGLAMFETRVDGGGRVDYANRTPHYRRLQPVSQIVSDAQRAGLTLVECQVSDTAAVFGDERPTVARTVFRRTRDG